MIRVSEFITQNQLGDPRDPQLSAKIVAELKARGYRQVLRNKARVWISPSEQGASVEKIKEILDKMS